MLHGLKQLRGYTARATDGDIGRVEDFLFDDEAWTIRYLVVETGGFLERIRVLVSPISFERVDWPGQRGAWRLDDAFVRFRLGRLRAGSARSRRSKTRAAAQRADTNG